MVPLSAEHTDRLSFVGETRAGIGAGARGEKNAAASGVPVVVSPGGGRDCRDPPCHFPGLFCGDSSDIAVCTNSVVD